MRSRPAYMGALGGRAEATYQEIVDRHTEEIAEMAEDPGNSLGIAMATLINVLAAMHHNYIPSIVIGLNALNDHVCNSLLSGRLQVGRVYDYEVGLTHQPFSGRKQ